MEVPPAPPASNNEEDLGKLLNARMVSGPGRRMLGGIGRMRGQTDRGRHYFAVNALTLFEKEALTRGAGSVRRWSSLCYFAPHRSDHVQSCRQQGVRERLCHSAPRRWCLGTVIPEDEGRP